MRQSPLDRQLIRGDEVTRVSTSAVYFLFNELCVRTKCRDPVEWESRLATLGQAAGARSYEISLIREPLRHRKTGAEDILVTVVAGMLWPRWFGKKGEVQRELGSESFLIVEENLSLTQFARSMPSEYYSTSDNPENPAKPLLESVLSLAAYVGGMVEGALHSAGFPAKVSSFEDPNRPQAHKSLFRVEFEPVVLERERRRQK